MAARRGMLKSIFWTCAIPLGAMGLFALLRPASEPPKTITPATAEQTEARLAASREKAQERQAAEKAKNAKIEAALSKLEVDGVSRDDLKDYFRDEIEEEIRDEADDR
jgi:DNA-nicking Smr family endonuclease